MTDKTNGIVGIRTVATAALVLMCGTAPLAQAEVAPWQFEITPYLWAAGINADVTVRGHKVEIDKSFSDIIKAVDIGGSFLTVAQHGHLVLWGQLDYFALSTDELSDSSERGTLDSDLTMATLAIGYQFTGSNDALALDVLLGVRHLTLENKLHLNEIGFFRGERSLTDPVVILRPSIRLSKRWRLNPTFSYGSGGDSEKVYELQPQLQYQISDRWVMRFGYRKLHYEIKSDSSNDFDGAFQGLLIGVGGTFGH